VDGWFCPEMVEGALFSYYKLLVDPVSGVKEFNQMIL
jgi:hypothetical protein